MLKYHLAASGPSSWLKFQRSAFLLTKSDIAFLSNDYFFLSDNKILWYLYLCESSKQSQITTQNIIKKFVTLQMPLLEEVIIRTNWFVDTKLWQKTSISSTRELMFCHKHCFSKQLKIKNKILYPRRLPIWLPGPHTTSSFYLDIF